MAKKEMLRPPVEIYYKDELDALKANDNYPKPKNWNLSPVSIKKFIMLLKPPEIVLRRQNKQRLVVRGSF